MPYDPVEVVPKCMGPLYYWQGLGDVGDVWLFSLFSFLERFPLRLKCIDHRVPQDVGSGDASSGGFIILYYVTRGKESLLGLCSEDEGWCWDCCPGCCVCGGVRDLASRASETVCNLFYCVSIKVHQIVNGRDPFISQLHYRFVWYSHLCGVPKEICCLKIFSYSIFLPYHWQCFLILPPVPSLWWVRFEYIFPMAWN